MHDDTSPADELVPDPKVCAEFSVTDMTLWRWDQDPKLVELGWPPPIRIRKRKFRQRRALEAFKRRLVQLAINQRQNIRAPKAAGGQR